MKSAKEDQVLFKKYKVTSRKYMGDDSASHAVFVAGRPVMTGLTRAEVGFYKRQVLGTLHKSESVDRRRFVYFTEESC